MDDKRYSYRAQSAEKSPGKVNTLESVRERGIGFLFTFGFSSTSALVIDNGANKLQC